LWLHFFLNSACRKIRKKFAKLPAAKDTGPGSEKPELGPKISLTEITMSL
jgi:hypothetical protein